MASQHANLIEPPCPGAVYLELPDDGDDGSRAQALLPSFSEALDGLKEASGGRQFKGRERQGQPGCWIPRETL